MRPLPLVLLMGVLSPAGLADDVPDADFLEYLGSWEDTDAEWIAVADWKTEEKVEPETGDRVTEERKDDGQEG